MEKKINELAEKELLEINGGSMHSVLERGVDGGTGGNPPPPLWGDFMSAGLELLKP